MKKIEQDTSDPTEVLRVRELYGGYGEDYILKGITLKIRQSEIVAVSGPNGCGKSSFVRGICNLLPHQKGEIKIQGREFNDLGRNGFARLVSVVPQQVGYEFQFTVEELVKMGRIPHVPRFKSYTKKDLDIINGVIKMVGLESLRDRRINTLSGGEKQRVTIAQALAQEPQLLILDEPTTFLDLNHQVEIMELLQELSEKNNLTVLLTSHDINLAAMFCSRLLIMKDGQFVTDGIPSQVLSQELLKEVYGVDSVIIKHPDEDTPHLLLRKKQTVAQRKKNHKCGM